MLKATQPRRGGIWSTGFLISAQMLLTWCLANNVTWDRKLGAACGSRGDGWPAQPWNPLPPRLKGRPHGGWGPRGAQGKGSEAVLLGGFAERTGLGAWGHQTRSPLHPGAQRSSWRASPSPGRLALVTGLAPPTKPHPSPPTMPRLPPSGPRAQPCAGPPCAHTLRSHGLSPAGAVQRRGPAAAGPPGLHRLPA